MAKEKEKYGKLSHKPAGDRANTEYKKYKLAVKNELSEVASRRSVH